MKPYDITDVMVLNLTRLHNKKLKHLSHFKKVSIIVLASLFALNPAEGFSEEINNKARLGLTVQEAALMALENNKNLQIERLNPGIRETFITEQEAVYDPRIAAERNLGSDVVQRNLGNSAEFNDITGTSDSNSASATKSFPTGTTAGVDFSTSRATRSWDDRRTDQTITRLGASFTQTLLQGRDPEANLATLNQAKIDLQVSEYELRGVALTLVSDTEKAYWDYSFAQRQLRIFEESITVALQQLNETEERVKLGDLPQIELITVQAELAALRQDSLTAKGNFEKSRLNLLRLINPSTENWAGYSLNLEEDPVIPDIKLDDVKSHVILAHRMRPEINQTILQIRRNELDIVRTKDGMLPKLDMFITMGKTGYADSFINSLTSLAGGNGYDINGGVRIDYPFGNRASEARYDRANLTHQQSMEVLENLKQLVEMDVRSSYIDIKQAREQIEATEVTTKLQQERLRVEIERFRVGRSTAFMVAQAQREFIRSRIAGVQAVVNYLKIISDFFRFDGTLLERRGIKAPGHQQLLP